MSSSWPVRFVVSTAALFGAIGAALVLFSLILLTSGKNPIDTYVSIVSSTLGNEFGFTEIFVKMIPLVLTAMAVALPARMGLVNVGGEGQLYIGALLSASICLSIGPGVSPWIGIPISIAFGMLGGALWAIVPALLRAKGWLNETISTLLLNYVAIRVVDFFIYGPLRDPESANVPQSPTFAADFLWPSLIGRIHIGIVLALVLVVLVAFFLNKTRWGYEIRAMGSNPLASGRHGLPIASTLVLVLAAGGALAGLAGTGEIMAIQGRLRPHFSPDYGYLGFLIAWLSGHKPLRVVVMAFLVSLIATGGDSLQLDQGLPSATVNIFMALILFMVLADAFRPDKLEAKATAWWARRTQKRAAGGAT